jgi:hypothetical protein
MSEEELERLRRYVDALPEPGPEQLGRARAALHTAMTTETATPPGPQDSTAARRAWRSRPPTSRVAWVGLAVVLVAIGAGIPLLVTRPSNPSRSRTGSQSPSRLLVKLVADDLSATVAAGNYDMTYSDTTTSPTKCPPAGTGPDVLPSTTCGSGLLAPISGHGTVDTNPYAMVTVTDVGPLGTITLYDNGTDVWEIGGGDYGLAGPGQAGPGAPLSGYAGSVEGTLGAVAGALDMQGLASGTGYLDIEAQEIQGAQPAGTGSVDGVPVTIYKLSESGLLDPDIGGLTPQQSATIRAADAIIASSGFAGKTTWLSVDSEGYIREQKTEYTLPDGSVVTGDTILSNFGCAGTVVMPGQAGATAPPAGCVSPDHAGAGSTPSPTTLPPSPAPTTAPTAPSTSPPPAASTSGLNRPEGLAVAPDGDLLIVNQGTNQILRRLPDGTLQVVAGTGEAGYSGDGGPAVQAELDRPNGIAVAPDGTMYVADTSNNRVRAISPSGIISTVAGNGQPGGAQSGAGASGGSATGATLADPQSVAVGPQGQLYIADSAGIQVVSDGTLTTLNPSGLGALGIGPAAGLTADAITVDQAGDLYVGDFSPKMLVELSPTGSVLHGWGAYVAPGGGLATAPDGSVLVADFGFTVDRVSNGQLAHIATFSLDSVPGVTGSFRPSGVAVTPGGTIYVDTDGANGGTDTPVLGVLDAQGQLQVLASGPTTTPLPG